MTWSWAEWFSHLSVHLNHLQGLLKFRLETPFQILMLDVWCEAWEFVLYFFSFFAFYFWSVARWCWSCWSRGHTLRTTNVWGASGLVLRGVLTWRGRSMSYRWEAMETERLGKGKEYHQTKATLILRLTLPDFLVSGHFRANLVPQALPRSLPGRRAIGQLPKLSQWSAGRPGRSFGLYHQTCRRCEMGVPRLMSSIWAGKAEPRRSGWWLDVLPF